MAQQGVAVDDSSARTEATSSFDFGLYRHVGAKRTHETDFLCPTFVRVQICVLEFHAKSIT